MSIEDLFQCAPTVTIFKHIDYIDNQDNLEDCAVVRKDELYVGFIQNQLITKKII